MDDRGNYELPCSIEDLDLDEIDWDSEDFDIDFDED